MSTAIPGLFRDLLTYLTERIKEVLTGTSSAIVVRVFGSDLDELRATAREVSAAIQDVAGVTTLKVEPQVLVPQISIRLRPEAAARFGLTPGRSDAVGRRAGKRRAGRGDLSKAKDYRRGGAGRAPTVVRRNVIAIAHDRHTLGRPSFTWGRGRDSGDARAQRNQTRRGLAPDRRDVQRRRTRPGKRGTRNRAARFGARQVSRGFASGVSRRVRRSQGVAATDRDV